MTGELLRAGFYSAKNEAAAKALGVKRVCIPNRATKNLAHFMHADA